MKRSKAICPEAGNSHCIDTEEHIKEIEEIRGDYCPCGNTPIWVEVKELSSMVLKKQTLSRNTVEDVQPIPEEFTVIDFETTGFNPDIDLVIEIGAVRYVKGEPVAILNFMVYQDIDTLKPEVTEATGHTVEDVKKGIPEELAIKLLLDFIDSYSHGVLKPVIVGQNILFDYEFLIKAVRRNWDYIAGMHASAIDYDDVQNHDLFDTLTIGRDRKPYPHRLDALCKRYDVVQENWHSAYYDCLATGDLFLAMHEEDYKLPKGARQVADYRNVIGYKRQYGKPEWCPQWIYLMPQGTITTDENKKTIENIVEKAQEIIEADMKQAANTTTNRPVNKFKRK